MSNPNDYTVGWVCALTCEYVAAQEFLDEEHDPPDSLQPNDSNDYTLGRIGRHKVVVAVLPDGEYGTATAASVATSMLNSFPNIRIGLMVGIGGGAPSPTNDIRLGDIVVSAPREANGVTYGGVFEYDFGKTIQDQAFQETRFLNQPPTTLRAAVRGLQAQYARKGHQLGQAVSDVLGKNSMLQHDYSRPHPSTDVLFRSEFTHDSRGCAEFCAKDPSKLVPRRPRTVYHETPAIHYGIIASANQLMKNAITRDRLAKERNVLCFEMEAAGLMNDFPCLVIRGICDYSDSHKNKAWQGYAAMVAAAYAKDLLNRIIPSRIENEQRISELFSTTLHALGNTGENVDVIKSRSDRRMELEMLNWLTTIDYGPQQSDIFRRRQPGTGQWVVDSDQYQTWIATKGKTLFCPGMPGAGKTIVASVVVNHLIEKLREDPDSGLAYIYCDFRRRNEQTVEHFVSSLLKQLAEKRPTLPDAVRQLHDRHEKSRTRPSLEELLESLHYVTDLFSHVFIVVDALDECQESNHCLPRFLSGLFDLQQKLGVNIFATARPLGHIKSRFENSISIEIRAHHEDVRKYVNGRMGELPMIVQRNLELQESIMGSISRAVDGMGVKDTQRSQEIPLYLYAARNWGHHVRDASVQKHRQVIALLESSGFVQASVGAFSREKRLELSRREASTLNTTGLHLAAYFGLDETVESLLQRGHNPNLASKNLHTNIKHTPLISATQRGHEAVVKALLLGRADPNWADYQGRTALWWAACGGHVSIAKLLLDKGADPNHLDIHGITVLGVACELGHTSVVETLLPGARFDLKSRNLEPLFIAVTKGHEGVVETLLNKGTIAGPREGWAQDALHFAVENGRANIIPLLLHMGANPYQDQNTGLSSQSPQVFHAVREDNSDIVEIFLEWGGADSAHIDHWSKLALFLAAETGRANVVEMLLKRGVDPNSTRPSLRGPFSALAATARNGRYKMFQPLFAYPNIDPTIASGSSTPLLEAATAGHKRTVEVLLADKRVLQDLKRTEDQRPLLAAVNKGHMEVARLLVVKGGIKDLWQRI
ncbi:hypothetical protein ACHAPT_004360 [Fusarium lateritium]